MNKYSEETIEYLDQRKNNWEPEASIDLNGYFFCISTMSGCSAYRPDLGYERIFLVPSAANSAIGEALLLALSRSRFVDPRDPANEEFLHFRKSAERSKIWVAETMKQFGLKTKTAMFKNMKHCSVSHRSGQLIIKPWIHVKLQAWSREKGDGIEDVVIADTASPEEIGAAVHLAFSRCR